MDGEAVGNVRSLSPLLVAELLSVASVEQLQGRFLDEVTWHLGSFAAGIYLHDRATGRPSTLEVRGLGSYYVHRYEKYGRDQDPVVRHAVQHQEVCDSDALMPYADWVRLPVVREVFLPHDMARVLCAPVVVGGEVVGTLNLARNADQSPFAADDREEAAVAARVLGAGVSAVRTRSESERQRGQLSHALDACGIPVVITDLELARRHYNAPAAELLGRLGPARAGVERLFDCDDHERISSLEVEPAADRRTRLTVRSHRSPDHRDMVISTIIEDDCSSVRISPADRRLLTPREADVAAGVLAGRRDAEIASSLLMSTHTVKHHLKSVYAKLDVHSRAQLVQRLMR